MFLSPTFQAAFLKFLKLKWLPRETYSLLEYGKAQVLCGRTSEGLETLERVLEIATEAEWKDFEFIVDIEKKIAGVLRILNRGVEADEIERRLTSITEVIED